jgi:hypothetical protein
MADEPLGARAGEYNGMDAGISVDAVDQAIELVGDVDAEQAVRPSIDSHDQNRSAVLEHESALLGMGHGRPFDTA